MPDPFAEDTEPVCPHPEGSPAAESWHRNRADTRAAAARGLERARSVLAAHAPKETRTK